MKDIHTEYLWTGSRIYESKHQFCRAYSRHRMKPYGWEGGCDEYLTKSNAKFGGRGWKLICDKGAVRTRVRVALHTGKYEDAHPGKFGF